MIFPREPTPLASARLDEIQKKLNRKGEPDVWLGLGFGGLYEVARTHEFLKNYGHAHYSWAWFNLRFGRIGYIYLAIMVLALAYNGFYGIRSRMPVGLLVALLAFFSTLYFFTYVNAVFLICELQVLWCRKDIVDVKLEAKPLTTQET